MYTLNSMPGVKIDRKEHGKYSVNDLVLELSHMVERDTLKKCELKMLEKNLKE